MKSMKIILFALLTACILSIQFLETDDENELNEYLLDIDKMDNSTLVESNSFNRTDVPFQIKEQHNPTIVSIIFISCFAGIDFAICGALYACCNIDKIKAKRKEEYNKLNPLSDSWPVYVHSTKRICYEYGRNCGIVGLFVGFILWFMLPDFRI